MKNEDERGTDGCCEPGDVKGREGWLFKGGGLATSVSRAGTV